MEITVSQYAEQRGITPAAVRESIRRYSEELQEHITLDGRTQLLDEAAVEFLDSKRKKAPTVILDTQREEEIEELKAQVQDLQQKLAEGFTAMAKAAEMAAEYADLKAEVLSLRDENRRLTGLLEAAEKDDNTSTEGENSSIKVGFWQKFKAFFE